MDDEFALELEDVDDGPPAIPRPAPHSPLLMPQQQQQQRQRQCQRLTPAQIDSPQSAGVLADDSDSDEMLLGALPDARAPPLHDVQHGGQGAAHQQAAPPLEAAQQQQLPASQQHTLSYVAGRQDDERQLDMEVDKAAPVQPQSASRQQPLTQRLPQTAHAAAAPEASQQAPPQQQAQSQMQPAPSQSQPPPYWTQQGPQQASQLLSQHMPPMWTQVGPMGGRATAAGSGGFAARRGGQPPAKQPRTEPPRPEQPVVAQPPLPLQQHQPPPQPPRISAPSLPTGIVPAGSQQQQQQQQQQPPCTWAPSQGADAAPTVGHQQQLSQRRGVSQQLPPHQTLLPALQRQALSPLHAAPPQPARSAPVGSQHPAPHQRMPARQPSQAVPSQADAGDAINATQPVAAEPVRIVRQAWHMCGARSIPKSCITGVALSRG